MDAQVSGTTNRRPTSPGVKKYFRVVSSDLSSEKVCNSMESICKKYAPNETCQGDIYICGYTSACVDDYAPIMVIFFCNQMNALNIEI